MSLITQRTSFFAANQSFHFDSDPNTIESIEMVALALGANRDTEDHSRLYFNLKDDKTSKKALEALENVINQITTLHSFKICISCGNQSIIVEGNDNTFNALYAIIKAFNKDIIDDTVTFSEEELNRFEAIQSVAVAMGILPYC